MRRDTLELADDSLFINEIQHTFKAAGLPFNQDTHAITIAGALLAPLRWQNPTDIGHFRKLSGTDAAITLGNEWDSSAPTMRHRQGHMDLLEDLSEENSTSEYRALVKVKVQDVNDIGGVFSWKDDGR